MPAIAILGASADRAKFGNKAVRAYRRRGWTVYPVNPKEAAVEGLPAFASLDDIPGPVDRVSVYLPPAVTLGLLDPLARTGAREVYLNPGADSPELLGRAHAMGIPVLAACAIVAVGEDPGDY